MKKWFFSFAFSLSAFTWVNGQNISGIINTYTAVTTIGAASVTVVSSAGFTAGAKVLLIEMQGASINQTNNSNFGAITSYGNSGNYEFDTISSVAGNVISFKNNLTTTFDAAGNVQLITVPVYNNAIVTGTLTCKPWNGSTGGVLVFQSLCTLTLNANIDVSKLGFRGGSFVNGGFGCADFNFYLNFNTNSGGEKGESISEYLAGENGGMGKQANGGGGGNPGNSGGGGGASYGGGGMGGYEYSGCGATGVQGYGGEALSNAGNRIFMGGGGGGGFADNGQAVTSGGNGGAIVYIIANLIVGNSYAIVDTGQSVTGYSSDESSGGGGAGGSVILSVPNYNTPISINTNGGYGGSSFNHIFIFDCHGPGGGGGGGLLWTGATLSPNITYTSSGGAAGLVLNPSSSCYNTSFGATAGGAGGVLNTPIPSTHVDSLNLGDDTTLCFGKSVLLNAGSGFVFYLWQDNSTDSTLTATTTGKYYVTAIDSVGCTVSDTVLVTVEQPIKFNIGDDTSLCIGSSLVLQAPAGYASYLWQDGSTSTSYNANSAGTYYVTVTDTIGCKGSDTSIVKIYPKDSINLGNPAICSGKAAVLNAGVGFVSYLWKDGTTNQIDSAKTAGLYSVIVTDSGGCHDSASVQVVVSTAPVISLGNDTALCKPFSKLLNPGAGYSSYLWLDSATNITSTTPTYTATVPGKYTVTVSDSVGCSSKDSIEIANKCPEVQFPNAFIPGTGANGVFQGYGSNVLSYDLKIYSRWGVLIFETNDIDNGWDGRFNGLPEPIGVYVYVAQYVGVDKVTHREQGNITLLR